MKAGIISFTEHGRILARKLVRGMGEKGILCEAWLKKKDAVQEDQDEVLVLTGSLTEWTKEQFNKKDVLVYIGAAGIAVRSIAPFIKSKKTDPAVIVVDEQGKHAISLLSGHIGGANAMTLLTAELLGAEPVITTATDLNGKFAVDAFAARRNLYMDSMVCAKEIASELVAGHQTGMRSAFPVFGRVPEELDQTGTPRTGFSVDIRRSSPFERTLHLVPRVVTLGIGCRKGMAAEQIEALVEETLEQYGIFRESVECIASIELKKEEEGIRRLADSLGVPFQVYTAEELRQVSCEDGFTESDFVRSVTGVGNVCERAALLGAGTDRLLIPKTAREGVTMAAAVRDYTVCMED